MVSGIFDVAHDRNDIAAGTKLDLPCWLAQSLSTSRHRTVTVEIPKIYRLLHRNILQADAQIVCLPKFSLHYYDFGLHMLQFAGPESRQIFETLLQTFTSRFRMLMDKSNNFDFEEKLVHLDKSEKTIYDSARKCAIDFSDWRTRKMEKIVATSAAIMRPKRKLDSVCI
uniref:DNA replication complex GINS protein PSF3 n=1 Tax=Romanomermis culicivorax TaxID=13658 RepID=A0A915HS97_ROMCU